MADYGFQPPQRTRIAPNLVGKDAGVKQTSPASVSKTATSDRDKLRIYQVFDHNIELDELSIPATESSRPNKEESLASLEYPLIRINDYILSNTEIETMKIDCTEFMPRIILTCEFEHHTFLSREMPKDGDLISIAIRNKSDLLKQIRNDYVITGVLSSPNSGMDQGVTRMTFLGSLFVPGFSSSKGKFSFNGTSRDTLEAYARWLKLGFATNEDDTNDKQIWLYHKYGTDDEGFAKDIALNAFKDDKSFYSVWIDVYYNLNFVNINRQLMVAENETDIAVWLNNIDKDFMFGEDTKATKVIETPKVLSNYKMFKATSFFIDSWKPENQSSSVTFQIGTKTWCQLFEHNNNIYADASKNFWSVEMEPTYDPDKINKYILLRGRAQQDPSSRGKDLARANYDFTDIYARFPWMGVQYTVSNPNDDNLKWTGNHHKNYYRAKVQNIINNKELEKLNVHVKVNGMNLNIIKGDKIPIALIKTDPVENKLIDKNVQHFDLLDQFYSGWYIVKGFNILYTTENANEIMSNFTQTFILTRREWPPPVTVDAIPLKSPNQNNT